MNYYPQPAKIYPLNCIWIQGAEALSSELRKLTQLDQGEVPKVRIVSVCTLNQAERPTFLVVVEYLIPAPPKPALWRRAMSWVGTLLLRFALKNHA